MHGNGQTLIDKHWILVQFYCMSIPPYRKESLLNAGNSLDITLESPLTYICI